MSIIPTRLSSNQGSSERCRAHRKLRGPTAGCSGRHFAPPLNRSVGPTRTQLQVFEETVVRGMRADPEPGDLVIVQKPKGAVSQGHASGEDRIAMVNLLELKAWVAGVVAEQPIRLSSGFLISGGRSRYAAQKRGVARDLKACPGRVPSLCRQRGRPEPRPRACSEPPARSRTGGPTAHRPQARPAAIARCGPVPPLVALRVSRWQRPAPVSCRGVYSSRRCGPTPRCTRPGLALLALRPLPARVRRIGAAVDRLPRSQYRSRTLDRRVRQAGGGIDVRHRQTEGSRGHPRVTS